MRKIMNQIFRTKMLYLFAGVFMAMFILMPGTSVKAATYPADNNVIQYEKGKTAVVALGIKDSTSNWYTVQVGSKPIYEGITIKSSNQKIVKTEKDGACFINVKKAGTSRLTIAIKKNGKTKKYNMNVKVVKYVNPFETISINKKNIKSQLNTAEGYKVRYKVTGNKYVFKSKLKKNWKIVKFEYSTGIYDAAKNTYLDCKMKTRKGNSAKNFTISLKENQKIMDATVLMYNTKTKVSERISLRPTV